MPECLWKKGLCDTQVGTQKIRLLFNSHFLSLHLKIISWFCSFINPLRYLFKYSWKLDPYSLCLSPYKFKEFQSHSHLPDTRSRVYWRGQASVPCHCWWQVFCHRPTACRRHPAQSTSTTSTQLEHYWGRIFPGQFQKPQIFWFSTFPVRKARERSGFSLHSPITLPDLLGEQENSSLYDLFSSCFFSWDCQTGIQMSGSSRQEPRPGAESCTINAWIPPWLRATHSMIKHRVFHCQPSVRNDLGLLLIKGWDWTRKQKHIGQHHRGLTASKW